jgi:predicted CXXCH cytochrome family protein
MQGVARWFIVLVVFGAIAGIGWRMLRNPVANLADSRLKFDGTTDAAVQPVLLERPVTEHWLASLPDYAGSDSCRECHADECKTYLTHPMSRSLARTTAASELEDYRHVTKFSGPVSGNYDIQFHYSINKQPDRVLHSEIVADKAGTELGRLDVEAEYSVGSGKRGRSYIIEHGGRLYMSPITWYSQGQRWDLSPSYSKDNKHFERRIVAGCVVCHAGLAVPDPVQPNVFAENAFQEESIGCERCHGPGRSHIDAWRAHPEGPATDPIVNPADLSTELQQSVCYQCHLQGVGRVARYGKSDFDFQPGMHVADVWAIFIKGAKVSGDNTTEAVGQAEQMMSSRCYEASDGHLGCTSCHDPHLVPAENERVAFYRDRCLKCHDGANRPLCSVPEAERQADAPGDSCIACHMPALTANDVPHTSQTDHRIPRHPASSDTAPAGHVESAPWEVFGNDGQRLPQEEIDRALGILMARNAKGGSDGFLASRAIPLLQSWLAAHPDDLDVADTLGSAYSIIKDAPAARKVWEDALKYHPDSETLLLHLMVVCHDSQDFEAGIAYGQRLIEINPWHSQHFARLTHMLGQTGRLRDGIETASKAIQLKPWDYQLHGWLADAYEMLGDRPSSDRHLELFRKLKPLDKE